MHCIVNIFITSVLHLDFRYPDNCQPLHFTTLQFELTHASEKKCESTPNVHIKEPAQRVESFSKYTLVLSVHYGLPGTKIQVSEPLDYFFFLVLFNEHKDTFKFSSAITLMGYI